jgi:hypothetical protein
VSWYATPPSPPKCWTSCQTGPTTGYMRNLLVEHGTLPPRDERLAMFQSRAVTAQQRITTEEHRKLVARFVDGARRGARGSCAPWAPNCAESIARSSTSLAAWGWRTPVIVLAQRLPAGFRHVVGADASMSVTDAG